MFFFLLLINVWHTLGNARVAGLQKQLHLTDTQYQICVTVLYVYVFMRLINCATYLTKALRPYIVAELPANLLLRKVGPRLVMPTLLTIWGVMVILQGTSTPCCIDIEIHTFWIVGLVTSYGGLVAVRAFLGLVEGPMFPGIVLYLSGFYTRKELSIRWVVAARLVLLSPPQ